MDLKWLWLRLLPKRVFVWRGLSAQGVSLTFDDGPHKDTTEQFLRILRESNVAATFFLSGAQIEKYPDLLTKIHHEGHEIGNHSYHHIRMSGLSLGKIIRELRLTQEIVNKYLGYKPSLFRPPYGEVNLKIIIAALSCSLTTVLWSVDPKDYTLNKPEDILDKLMIPQMTGSEIILFHTYSDATLKALPQILQVLRQRGLARPLRDNG